MRSVIVFALLALAASVLVPRYATRMTGGPSPAALRRSPWGTAAGTD